jgi:drug/metabolite transporter (DMT)-like permease
MAVAYVVGFILLIQRCLQIGPMGPTITINNSAMVAGVAFSYAYLTPRAPEPLVVAGIGGTLVGVALTALKSSSGAAEGRRTDSRWLPMVIGGGLLSCVSFMCQTYAGERFEGLDYGLLYTVVNFGLSAVMLLAVTTAQREPLLANKRIVVGGIVVGAVNGLGMPLALMAIRLLGAEIVLPLTVALPMVLATILAKWLFGDRIHRLAWAGCALASVGLALLGYAKAAGGTPSG